MKSGKFKQIFYNYVLAALFACLAVNLINFATSTIGLFTKNHTPTYTKISDSISTGSHEEEAVALTAPEAPTKTIASSYARKVASPIHTVKATASAPTDGNYISINGRIFKLTQSTIGNNGAPTVPANHAGIFKSLIVGHNTSIFGFINNLPHDQYISLNVTISFNGQVSTYTGATIHRYTKAEIDPAHPETANPDSLREYTRAYYKSTHSIMTCANGSSARDLVTLYQ